MKHFVSCPSFSSLSPPPLPSPPPSPPSPLPSPYTQGLFSNGGGESPLGGLGSSGGSSSMTSAQKHMLQAMQQSMQQSQSSIKDPSKGMYMHITVRRVLNA